MTNDVPAAAYGVGIKHSRKKAGDTDDMVRCFRCDSLLAEKVTRPWVIKCRKCKARNKGEAGWHRARVGGDPTHSAHGDV